MKTKIYKKKMWQLDRTEKSIVKHFNLYLDVYLKKLKYVKITPLTTVLGRTVVKIEILFI